MNVIYHYLGMVAFWLIVAIAAWFIVGNLWQLWQRVKYRFWIFQVYEVIRFSRQFNRLKKSNGFKDFEYGNWTAITIHRARLLGKTKDFKYRQKHLFKRYLLSCYDYMMNTEAYDRFKYPEKYEGA